MNTIALVGAPNSGKTTLYNWLTGSKFKTVNYPGSTVDYSCGETLSLYGCKTQIIDTPGTYSLEPKSPEEVVTLKVLFDKNFIHHPKLIISVVDGTQFVRHIALTKQLIETGYPVIIALTMEDLLKQDGYAINLDILEKELGVPVVLINGQLGGGVKELINLVEQSLQKNLNETTINIYKPWTTEGYTSFFQHFEKIKNKFLQESIQKKQLSAKINTDRLDQFLLHPFYGGFIFLAIMTGLFISIFSLASPFMDIIDSGFANLAQLLLKTMPQSLFANFLANGVVAGFGALFIFIPQIFILFFGIKLLEDSGYLARAATLVDKPFTKLGLNGRAFIPVLSGYACAVPAMMAARNIPSTKERWLTLFILPLMTCSARIPVYALLLGFLFFNQSPIYGGLALAALYIVSFLLGGLISSIASRFMQSKDPSFLIMELPFYRRPKLLAVFKSALDKTWSFITRAGPVIFVLSILIWLGTTFPAYDIEDDGQRLQASYASQAGKWIEPVMEPMGLDWKAGVGIISSFAAREVFVSSLAMIYSVADNGDEEALQGSIIKAMKSSTHADGSLVYTFASIMGLIVFYIIALQCLATVAVAKKESGSWKFALFQMIFFNGLAYGLAVLTYQVLS